MSGLNATDSYYLGMARVLIYIAWADGVLTSTEKTLVYDYWDSCKQPEETSKVFIDKYLKESISYTEFKVALNDLQRLASTESQKAHIVVWLNAMINNTHVVHMSTLRSFNYSLEKLGLSAFLHPYTNTELIEFPKVAC